MCIARLGFFFQHCKVNFCKCSPDHEVVEGSIGRSKAVFKQKLNISNNHKPKPSGTKQPLKQSARETKRRVQTSMQTITRSSSHNKAKGNGEDLLQQKGLRFLPILLFLFQYRERKEEQWTAYREEIPPPFCCLMLQLQLALWMSQPWPREWIPCPLAIAQWLLLLSTSPLT